MARGLLVHFRGLSFVGEAPERLPGSRRATVETGAAEPGTVPSGWSKISLDGLLGVGTLSEFALAFVPAFVFVGPGKVPFKAEV